LDPTLLAPLCFFEKFNNVHNALVSDYSDHSTGCVNNRINVNPGILHEFTRLAHGPRQTSRGEISDHDVAAWGSDPLISIDHSGVTHPHDAPELAVFVCHDCF
jgi:hypothetical protein